MARPSLFNEAIAGEICERIADGDSLRSICEGADYPERRTVFRWLADPQHAEFRRQYALAREASADADDDDIRDMAKRVEAGKLEHQAARVAIDAKKWSAGKRKPKVYGDKMALVGGGKDDAPISHSHAFDLKDASDEELEVIERFVRRRAADAGRDQGGAGEAEG
jgi:hypothetical protein